MNRSSIHLIKFYLLFSLMFIALSTPLPAFSTTLSMEYSLGFNGYYQIAKWTPLTVIVENRGRALNGKVEVLVTSGSEYLQDVYQSSYSMDVELPYSSKKLCYFSILINSFAHELIIRFKQGQKVIISQSLDLRPYYTTKSLAVVLDDRISPDVLGTLPEVYYPVGVHSRFLPENWYGYEGVELFITPIEMLNSLRRRQFQALETWVQHGGFLVIAGGSNYSSLLEKRIARLLPLKISGHQQFTQLKSLERFCGQKLAGPDPFLILKVKIKEANVLIKENDIPIVSQKRTGIGKIVFLSFDFKIPPFSRWDHRHIFWDKIQSLKPEINDTIDLDTQKILKSMTSKIMIGFPNLKIVYTFLLIYILLLRHSLKKLEKPAEKRWRPFCYLLTVIVIFSTASYRLFYYPSTRSAFTTNRFLQMNLSGSKMVASGKLLIGLYSINKLNYQLKFGSLFYPVTHLLFEDSDRKTPNKYVIHEDYSGQQVVGSLDKWSYNFYKIGTKFRFPITGQADVDEKHLKIMIENRTAYKITDCRVYYNKRLLFLGDIWANRKQIKYFSRSDLEKKEFFNEREAENIVKGIKTNGSYVFLKTMQKKLTKDILLAVHSKYKSKHDSVCIIGWIQKDIVPVDFNTSGIIGEALTLVNWEIPVNQI